MSFYGDISDALDDINWLIRADGGYEAIDRILYKMETTLDNYLIVLAILRYTAPVRIKLSMWHTVVLRTRTEMKNIGLDADVLLRGLY